MSAVIQKLIQEDLKKLEARYGRDSVLAEILSMYSLVDSSIHEKVKAEAQLYKMNLKEHAVSAPPEYYNPCDYIDHKELEKIFSSIKNEKKDH